MGWFGRVLFLFLSLRIYSYKYRKIPVITLNYGLESINIKKKLPRGLNKLTIVSLSISSVANPAGAKS